MTRASRCDSSDSPLRCRFCDEALGPAVIDLGSSPLCESYRTAEQLDQAESFYPLRAHVCGSCFLMQVPDAVSPEEIFREYAYFSSYSESWVAHAAKFAGEIAGRLGLGRESLVVEIGSNDGYLLRHFVARGIPVLGIEPARNVAAAAIARGVPTRAEFFGREAARVLASQGCRPDLVVVNNVLAQVSDLNGFVAGLAELAGERGVVTIEIPHLARLVDEVQFDTIYHEHFSYFSLASAERLLAAHRLEVFDVEERPTHGGSLRLYARRAGTAGAADRRVTALRAREQLAGLECLETYARFAERVRDVKRQLVEFLTAAKGEGRTVAGYGAPGKGNTLLNYCGIGPDLLRFTVDRNPYKQGKFLPGTHIPISPVERVWETRPDYLLLLPWNLREEITQQMAAIRSWGGRFVVPIPALEVLP